MVFDTTTLKSQEFSLGGLKAYIGTFHSFTLNDADLIIVVEFPVFFAESMLAQINKKDLAKRAKKMIVVAQAPPAQDLKLKVVFIIAPTPTDDDEETYSEPVFKRKRKTTATPSEISTSDGHAPSQQAPPPSPSPPRDMVVVQEDEGM